MIFLSDSEMYSLQSCRMCFRNILLGFRENMFFYNLETSSADISRLRSKIENSSGEILAKRI